MSQADKSGNYSNHSLRVTAATRIFDSGIEEQLVKEKTGHKSNAVCAYKHTSDQLMEKAEKAVICPGIDISVIPVNSPVLKEFNIDDDIVSFDLFCTKKWPKKSAKYCQNGLCQLFRGTCVDGKKVKKLKVSVEFTD